MSATSPAMVYRGRDPFTFRNIASRLRQIATLLRKELRENRWFILASLPILALVPLQYALGGHQSFNPGDGFGIIIILLASFAGIISGLRDLTDRRQDFWRSRPIKPHTFATTRLLAALLSWSVPAALAFIAYAVICSLQRRPGAPHDPYTLALSYLLTANLPQVFFAFAAFAIAHLAATLLRSAVDAALLTLAVLIALWLLPVILPPLSFLSTLQTMKNAPITMMASSGPVTWDVRADAVGVGAMGVYIHLRMHFLIHNATMLLIAAAAAALSCIAVIRNWHLPMGRKLTVWSLGLSTVFMLAAAGLQIRSTLSSTQELLLLSPLTGKACFVTQFIQTDRQLLAVGCDTSAGGPVTPYSGHAFYAFPLAESGASWSVGKPIPLGRAAGASIFSPGPHFWTSAQPDRIYTLDFMPSGSGKAVSSPTRSRLVLRETSLAPDTAGQPLRETDLLPIVGKDTASLISAYGNTLLLRPAYTAILPYDLSSATALTPEPIRFEPSEAYDALQSLDNSTTPNGQPHTPYALPLREIANLTPDELLDLNLKLAASGTCVAAYSSGRLSLFDYDRIRTYRQIDLTPTLARFTPTGRYDLSAVESLMYSHRAFNTLGASGDWIFRLYWSGGLRLFHLTDSSITLAGQFNRPADQLLAAHITGQYLLVGGQKLYIVPLPTPRP